MCRFKIRELIFGKGDSNLYLKVEDFKKDTYLTISVRELYLNVSLLDRFSTEDIRLITYLAAEEEFTQDLAYTKKLSRVFARKKQSYYDYDYELNY